MSRAAQPIRFSLRAEEMAVLSAPPGTGGHQGFHRWLMDELARNGGRGVMEFDDQRLGMLLRYMTQYGSGGFQGRLTKAFMRSVVAMLGGAS